MTEDRGYVYGCGKGFEWIWMIIIIIVVIYLISPGFFGPSGCGYDHS